MPGVGFTGEMVNAYQPDIVIEDVLQENGLVYVQLPANLFKTQAPALGRCVLADVQQEASLRQVFRTRKSSPSAPISRSRIPSRDGRQRTPRPGMPPSGCRTR